MNSDFFPKPARLIVCAAPLVVVLCGGCGPAGGPAEPAPARVEGDKILLPESAPQRKSLTVETATARTVNVTHLTGRLAWDEEATVRVFSPVGGRVTAVDAGLGQKVEAGATLARVSSPDFGQAQADVRKANADFILAERNLNRLRDLQAHGAAAQKDVEATEDTQAAALAEKERAAARLALYGGSAETLDGLFPLRAPLAGTVVERNVNPGQEVRADQMLGNVPQVFAPLFVLSEPTRLWVWVDVTENDMNPLKPGQEIHIHAKPYGERAFVGRLDVIGDTLDPATRTVKVRGTVPNPDRLLKAEMYVTVDLVTPAPPTAEIPAKAVFLKDNKSFVFIEAASGQFIRHQIKVDGENAGRIAVVEGVKTGERVVTEGCLLLEALLENKSSP